MSDRWSWVVRGLVAGTVVVTLGIMGCATQKTEVPVEEPPKAEVKPPPPPPPARPAPAPTAKPVGGEQSYTVQVGDTLFSIAKRYGVKLQDLQAANNIQNPNMIKSGQKLIIPAGGAPGAPKAGGLQEPF